MKRLRKCIIIISIIALILLLLMEVIWGDGDPRAKFICSWVRVILIFLVIPLVFGGLSLAYNADKIKPKIWMAIYGCVAFAYIAIVIRTGYINATRDLPLAIEREYSAVSGSMQSIDFDETSRFVEVGSIYFELPREDFETVDFDTEYTVTYLPNTQTVMSIDLEDRSD